MQIRAKHTLVVPSSMFPSRVAVVRRPVGCQPPADSHQLVTKTSPPKAAAHLHQHSRPGRYPFSPSVAVPTTFPSLLFATIFPLVGVGVTAREAHVQTTYLEKHHIGRVTLALFIPASFLLFIGRLSPLLHTIFYRIKSLGSPLPRLHFGFDRLHSSHAFFLTTQKEEQEESSSVEFGI